jgi:hypothetical protein
MEKLERIIEQVRRLPVKDRRRLITVLNRSLVNGSKTAKEVKRTKKRPRAEAPYAISLTFAGTARSDYSDVSSNKYKHLADIYADHHERV